MKIYFVSLIFLWIGQGNCLTTEDVVMTGHMKPLGQQRPPSVLIDEYHVGNFPTPEEFFNNYMKIQKATIFRGAVKDSRAYKLWTDEYLQKNFGDLEVRLEAKKEKDSVTPIGETYIGRDNLRHFIDNYHNNDSITYVVSELPSPMYKDVGVMPTLAACGPMKDRFVEIDIWWSGGNSRSIIHKDAYNQFNCLINGTKYWKLFEYKYEKYLHKHWEPENQVGGFSEVDVAAVNLHKTPNITKVPWSNFTINAGDCLYLPKSYYHQIDSVGTHNLAVSILYGRMDGVEDLDFSDCNENTDYKSLIPLSEIEVDWTWSGKGAMSMGQTDLMEGYRGELLQLAQELDKSKFGLNKAIMLETFQIPDSVIDQVMSVLDRDGDGKISSEDVKNCKRTHFRTFAELTQPYEPSNHYEFEYSVISYDSVVPLLLSGLQLKKVLTREVWIQAYMKRLRGTRTFANEIFTKLAGSEEAESVESDKIGKEEIKAALVNWRKYFAPQYSGAKNVRQADNRFGLLDESVVYNEAEEEEDGDEEEYRGEEMEDDDENEQDQDEGDEEMQFNQKTEL